MKYACHWFRYVRARICHSPAHPAPRCDSAPSIADRRAPSTAPRRRYQAAVNAMLAFSFLCVLFKIPFAALVIWPVREGPWKVRVAATHGL